MIEHMKMALNYQEKMSTKEWTEKQLNPVFNYMNVATLYDLAYDPPLTDSTRVYVEKVRQANRLDWATPIDHAEGDIKIRDMQAWIYYYDHQYGVAEREMTEVLALIDSVSQQKPGNILVERGDAYEFLTMLYEETGQTEKALQCQRLLNENNLQRYSVERNQAMHEVETRYETEKKETAIANLHRQNRLLIIMLGVVAVASLLAIVLWMSRHRLRKQRLYTKALQADAEMQAEHTSLTLLADQLKIDDVDLTQAQKLMRKSVKPLTVVDQKYILCLLSGESVRKIAR